MIIDILKAEEFIVFLLNRIEDYKKDWYISDNEVQELINELDNFKNYIEVSPLIPGKIKERILNLNLNTKQKISKAQRYFDVILDYERTDNSLIQAERKEAFDILENELQNIYRLLLLEK